MSISADPSQGSRLCLPDARIIDHEARGAHFEVHHKLTARAFVAIRVRVQAAVDLWERFQREARKSQPGSPDLRRSTNCQPQTADRKQVGRGTEVQVYICTLGHSRLLHLIQPPASTRMSFNLKINEHVAHPAFHQSEKGMPGFVT